jgi:hypothetical protein
MIICFPSFRLPRDYSAVWVRRLHILNQCTPWSRHPALHRPFRECFIGTGCEPVNGGTWSPLAAREIWPLGEAYRATSVDYLAGWRPSNCMRLGTGRCISSPLSGVLHQWIAGQQGYCISSQEPSAIRAASARSAVEYQMALCIVVAPTAHGAVTAVRMMRTPGPSCGRLSVSERAP